MRLDYEKPQLIIHGNLHEMIAGIKSSELG